MLVQGGVQRQQQTPGMVPEHIMGKAILKMGIQELQQFMEVQMSENPALSMEETGTCPACGCCLIGSMCPVCGSGRLEEDLPYEREEFGSDLWASDGDGGDEFYEPFACVAAPVSLAEYLREQIPIECPDGERTMVRFIIESLDDDGYLREPLLDIAGAFGVSVPQLEAALGLVQSFDPPGIAARDLQECLVLQLLILGASPIRDLAVSVVRDQWANLERMRLDRIAAQLSIDPKEVSGAILFIRKHTNPRPSAGFRDRWERFTPRRIPRSSPDIAVVWTEHGLDALIVDPGSGRLGIESSYADLADEVSKGKARLSERDKAHVRESFAKAKALIEGLEFRKSTLRRIVDDLLKCQASFFTEGPSALLPLTRKELAARLGLHESTISRATQDKSLRLPSGEVITFDVIFDSALPVKELVRRLAEQHLTDGEIAERLTSEGIQIARRTVAKYREQLGVLAVGYRMP